MQRLRGYDLRVSRLPGLLGLCSDDMPRLFDFLTTSQQRLLYAKEAGEESWFGTWAEVAFNLSREAPYITLPRGMARLEMADVCTRPIPIHNQFFEYLQFGNGRFPKSRCGSFCTPAAYSRNNVPTFVDLSNPPQNVIVYITSQQDVGKRILIQGLDQNNNTIYSQDVFQRVTGVYVGLDTPFVTAPVTFNTITGIQKDITAGAVHVFQMDPTTGAQIKLLTMEPTETVASYRRYYFNGLPNGCCPDGNGGVQVTAIAKLEPTPIMADTDYLVIQNKEAIIEECQSVRLSEIDNSESKSMAMERHKAAIALLQGELSHYMGLNDPAVVFAPFGSAKLTRVKIGMI